MYVCYAIFFLHYSIVCMYVHTVFMYVHTYCSYVYVLCTCMYIPVRNFMVYVLHTDVNVCTYSRYERQKMELKKVYVYAYFRCMCIQYLDSQNKKPLYYSVLQYE
jgi:hypothetical protein